MKTLALATLLAFAPFVGSASAQMASKDGMHTMDGEVTNVDAKKLHFPSPALDNVKVGDSITVELGMKKISSAK
jgi:hypothetical protein